MKTVRRQLWYLGIVELVIFFGTFLFIALDFYAQQYRTHLPQLADSQQMSFLSMMIGFVIFLVFFIVVIRKVRSILQFSVVCVLTLVQLWITYSFLSSGAYSYLEYSVSLGMSWFVILSGLHLYIAKRILQTLNEHEFVQ